MTNSEAVILLRTMLLDMVEYPSDIIHGNKYMEALYVAVSKLEESNG